MAKPQSGDDLNMRIDCEVQFKAEVVASMEADTRQALEDLGLTGRV